MIPWYFHRPVTSSKMATEIPQNPVALRVLMEIPEETVTGTLSSGENISQQLK